MFYHSLSINGSSKEILISIEEFNESISHLVEETINISKKLVEELDISDNEISGIILVGGSTRIKLIRKRLEDRFNTTIYDDTDPDLVVSEGAALHGNDIVNGSKNLLLDVTPLSLGIETMGDLMEKLLQEIRLFQRLKSKLSQPLKMDKPV